MGNVRKKFMENLKIKHQVLVTQNKIGKCGILCIMENMYSQTIAKRKYKNKRIKIINEKKKSNS